MPEQIKAEFLFQSSDLFISLPLRTSPFDGLAWNLTLANTRELLALGYNYI